MVKRSIDSTSFIPSVMTTARLATEPWQAFTRAVVLHCPLPDDGSPAHLDVPTLAQVSEYAQHGGHVLIAGVEWL